MSVHLIGKNPNSLAFGVPFLTCTLRAAAKPGLRGLVYFSSKNSLGFPFPTNVLHPLYQTHYTSIVLPVTFFHWVQTKLPIFGAFTVSSFFSLYPRILEVKR